MNISNRKISPFTASLLANLITFLFLYLVVVLVVGVRLRADTYQYQLQALWQKAWATGQGVMQNLRFRERGPFKTWRPETMAEAIMAVLREGLSLSQVISSSSSQQHTHMLFV